MRTYLDIPRDHQEWNEMVKLLEECGFIAILAEDPMSTALYYAYCHYLPAEHIDYRIQAANGWKTRVVIGHFKEDLPRHINPNDSVVLIDIGTRRVVSHGQST